MNTSTMNRDPKHLLCSCCDQQLDAGERFCCECQTPVSISQAIAARGNERCFISVLGSSNAGKTVYLGMLLDMLGNGSEQVQSVSTSSFSFDLQEQVVTALERRTFPKKTPSDADLWRWLHCGVAIGNRRSRQSIDLISPDFAGEAIGMEVNHPGSYPAIESVVRKSSGVLILCDSIRVRDCGSEEDLFAVKLAAYIADLHGLSGDAPPRRKRKRALGPAVGIVFTKCDECPEAMDDPAEFAKNNASRLFEFCQRTFSHNAFFATSVVGSSGMLADSEGLRVRVPFHIQPTGVVEPIEWIVSRN